MTRPFNSQEELFHWVMNLQYQGINPPYGVIVTKNFFDKVFTQTVAPMQSVEFEGPGPIKKMSCHLRGIGIVCVLDPDEE